MAVLTAFGILHNCAKASDNKQIYHRHKFIQVAALYKDKKTNPDIIVMPCIFTMSYVFLGDEVNDIEVPESTAQLTVNTLAGAVCNDDTHQEDGWHAYELAVGMTNLSANQNNIRFFVQKGVIKPLIKMLDFEDSYEQECALNAIWSLTIDSNKDRIVSTPNLAEKVRELTKSPKENIVQAAVRLKMKLNLPEDPGRQSVYETLMCRFFPLCLTKIYIITDH